MKTEIKQALDTLSLKHSLTASGVVSAASKKGSPLHDLFEWDDETAAHEHRLDQARRLIREYTIIVQVTPTKTANVRAFVNTSHATGREGVYEPRAAVVSDYEKRSRLLDQVLSQIERTLSLNADLPELAPILRAVNTVRERLCSAAAAE